MREPNRITHIEVSEQNKKLRMILIVVLLAVAVVAIGTGLFSILNRDTGWQEVEVATSERNCSQEFILQYHFAGSGAQATTLYKQISAVYTQACVKAYELFQVDVPSDAYENLYDINHAVNQIVTVDPVLYAAFEKLEGTPYLYLGPIYAHYNSLIFNTDESLLSGLDPALNQEAKAYVEQIMEFASNRQAISLELLGNHQLQLHVSEDYLAFAAENEIENFIDLRYMTNAFVIDYLAQSLQENGFTRGYLASCDGYTRNLDDQNTYNFNIFSREGNTIYLAGVMGYRGPISMVFLKDYSMAASDAYYQESGDHVVHTLADPADGMYRTSIPQLVCYSYDGSCADILLAMLPCMVTETFSVPQGVETVWCGDGTIFYTDPAVTFTELMEEEQMAYTTQLVQ